MSKSKYKIFIETSVLLAASVKCEKYLHKEYDSSKSLFNLFMGHIPLQLGWTSDTVIHQAENTLEKVVGDVISETEGSDLKNKDSVNYYNILSRIKDVAEDNLRRNIRSLTKMPIDETQVNSIKIDEVNPFFSKLGSEIKVAGQFFVSGVRLSSRAKKQIARGNRPSYKGKPDQIDLDLFSEAIYLKRVFLKKGHLLVASLDKHFAPYKKDPRIRDKIEKEFDIYCDLPREVYNKIKEILGDKK